MRTIEIAGMSFLVMEQTGRGEVPLLLLNGMRMKQGVYNRLKRHISAPTTSFDFPEMWRPSPWWFLSPMSDIARRVAMLIDALGYKQVDVFGVSWGGALAIEMAAFHGTKIRKLVLASTTARAHSLLRPTTLHAYFTKGYGGKARHEPELLAETKANAGRSSLTTDLYRGFALPVWFGMTRLPFITQETLVISGDDDTITPLSEAQFLSRWIPRSELSIVNDGHLAIYSSADEVAGVVNKFLS